MSFVLHDNPLSSNAQKVRFLLAELGQTAELREVPFAQPRPDWHLAVNPLGGIPAIVHDGFHLAESNTVLRYLATRSGDTQIYPSDLPDRATVNWLLDAIATFLRPALLPIEEAALGVRAGRGIGAEPPAADGGTAAFAQALPKLRALPGPARRRRRHGPAAAASRSPTWRRRRCSTGCAAAASADRDPAPRGLGRGLLRAPGLGRRRGHRRASRRAAAGRPPRRPAASRPARAPAACRATGSGRGGS